MNNGKNTKIGQDPKDKEQQNRKSGIINTYDNVLKKISGGARRSRRASGRSLTRRRTARRARGRSGRRASGRRVSRRR
jgi:hypothetical protein